MVMKGAIYLTADLMREITVPCMFEYVKASSYGTMGSERRSSNSKESKTSL